MSLLETGSTTEAALLKVVLRGIYWKGKGHSEWFNLPHVLSEDKFAMNPAQRPKLTKLKPFCLIIHDCTCLSSLHCMGTGRKVLQVQGQPGLKQNKKPQKQKGTNSIGFKYFKACLFKNCLY